MNKNDHNLKKQNNIFIVLVIFFVAIALLINSIYLIKRNDSITPNNANLILTSLQTGTNGAMKVQISNVTENDTFDPGFTIDPSQTILIMNISITNLTQETQNLVPDTQLYVRTDQGDYSTLHASMFVTNPLPATALKPGYTESGQVSFNVSKQASRPLVYIDTGWNNYAPIVYDVLH